LEINLELESIADVADRFGVTPRTLRFYEERGILNPIRRGQTRYYDRAQKLRVQMIVKAKQLGFALAEIAEMVEASDRPDQPINVAFSLDKDTIEKQLRHLEERREEIRKAIAELRAALRRPA
jgi:DNA-binding transcriptional MerR regulator